MKEFKLKDEEGEAIYFDSKRDRLRYIEIQDKLFLLRQELERIQNCEEYAALEAQETEAERQGTVLEGKLSELLTQSRLPFTEKGAPPTYYFAKGKRRTNIKPEVFDTMKRVGVGRSNMLKDEVVAFVRALGEENSKRLGLEEEKERLLTEIKECDRQEDKYASARERMTKKVEDRIERLERKLKTIQTYEKNPRSIPTAHYRSPSREIREKRRAKTAKTMRDRKVIEEAAGILILAHNMKSVEEQKEV